MTERDAPPLTTKEFLQQYKKAYYRLFHLDEQLYILRTKMESVRGVSQDYRVQTSPINKLETSMEQLILREQSQESERHTYAETMSRVREAITEVSDEVSRTLLEYRYLDLLDWDQIANLMEKHPDHVKKRMHGEALLLVKIPRDVPTMSP